MQTTRQDILDYIRRHSEATVRELGGVLRLTETGVRHHLTALVRDGLVVLRQTRGHAGRPALIYSLKPAGHALFPHRNDELANLLVEEIRVLAGAKGLQSILMRIAARSSEAYETRTEGKTGADRMEAVVEIITERGCLADFEAMGEDQFLINQYTCPFPQVAEANSAVCTLDVEFVRRLTGGDARLVSSLLRGEKCCSYRIRPTKSAAAI